MRVGVGTVGDPLAVTRGGPSLEVPENSAISNSGDLAQQKHRLEIHITKPVEQEPAERVSYLQHTSNFKGEFYE